MIDKTDIIDALTMCSGYDPAHFATASKLVVRAWLDHFDAYPGVIREDLLAAVSAYYRTPDRKMPQPADLSMIARDLKNRRQETETDEERDARIMANEERLGLPPEDRTFPSDLKALPSAATAEARRVAIENFARGRFTVPVTDAMPYRPSEDERLRALARSRSAEYRAAQPPTEDPNVAQEDAQPQESAS